MKSNRRNETMTKPSIKKIQRTRHSHTFESYAHVVSPLPADEGGGLLITFPDLPGCMSDGRTEIEAVSNGRDAFESWISARRFREIGSPACIQARNHSGRLGALRDAASEIRSRSTRPACKVRRCQPEHPRPCVDCRRAGPKERPRAINWKLTATRPHALHTRLTQDYAATRGFSSATSASSIA
jgi:predicted RNase H-like HicB family nuclease